MQAIRACRGSMSCLTQNTNHNIHNTLSIIQQTTTQHREPRAPCTRRDITAYLTYRTRTHDITRPLSSSQQGRRVCTTNSSSPLAPVVFSPACWTSEVKLPLAPGPSSSTVTWLRRWAGSSRNTSTFQPQRPPSQAQHAQIFTPNA